MTHSILIIHVVFILLLLIMYVISILMHYIVVSRSLGYYISINKVNRSVKPVSELYLRLLRLHMDEYMKNLPILMSAYLKSVMA